MPEWDELLRHLISDLEKEVDAAKTATHAVEVARALVVWVAAEGSLELLAEASTERDAKYTNAEYLAAALAEGYLAAERALRVSGEAVAHPGVTSAEEVEATKHSRI